MTVARRLQIGLLINLTSIIVLYGPLNYQYVHYSNVQTVYYSI